MAAPFLPPTLASALPQYVWIMKSMKCMMLVLIGTLAASAMAGTAAARTTTGVLNTLEVQRLVREDTVAAHVVLSRHYMALADEFAGDAARLDALAILPVGTPNHQVTSGAEVRRLRQAEDAMACSEAARRMAAYHEFLSMGMAPTPPPERTLFDGGFGAPSPTAAEMKAIVAAARGAADHRALEEYFTRMAVHHTGDAKARATLASNLRVTGQRRASEVAAMDCERLANEARKRARQATAAAALHHQLANVD